MFLQVYTHRLISHREGQSCNPPGQAPSNTQEEALSIDLMKDGPSIQDQDLDSLQKIPEPLSGTAATDITPNPMDDLIDAPESTPTQPKSTDQVSHDPARFAQEGPNQENGGQTKKQKNKSATATSQLLANAHKVQFPPSDTIDLGNIAASQAENLNPTPAITNSEANKGENIEGSRRKVRSNKAEPEKPLDAAELRRREKSLAKKEEALKLREKRMEQMEKELAEARAHIVMLEAKVRNEQESNRILDQRILLGESSVHSHKTPPTPVNAASQHPVSQPSHISYAPVDNAQVLNRLELMQLEQKINHMDLKHAQEINNMRQTYMLDRAISMQNYQTPSMFAPPVYVQPQLQYAYPGIQPARQPAWWGATPSTFQPTAYTHQQAYGSNPMGSMKPPSRVDRYIPNPAPNPTHSTSPRNPQAQQPQRKVQEAIEQKKPLYITFLDVKTAFDVFWHDTLLRK